MKTFEYFAARRCVMGLLILCSVWKISAQSVVYEATGTREQIQPVIDQFEHDIVYGISGTKQPSQAGSYGMATLDDLPSDIQAGYFTSGGLNLVTGPAETIYVSSNLSSYSFPNSLTVTTVATIPSGGFGVTAPHLPSEPLPLANAFGAVFANVTPLSTATLATMWDSYDVPQTSGADTFSFVGILGGPAFPIGSIRMQGLPGSIQDLTKTTISVDNIIFGNAVVPEPSSMVLVIGGLSGLIARRSFRALLAI